MTCASARSPTVSAVTEARRSSGVMTVIITWLGMRTPPVPIRERQIEGRAVRMEVGEARSKHPAAIHVVSVYFTIAS